MRSRNSCFHDKQLTIEGGIASGNFTRLRGRKVPTYTVVDCFRQRITYASHAEKGRFPDSLDFPLCLRLELSIFTLSSIVKTFKFFYYHPTKRNGTLLSNRTKNAVKSTPGMLRTRRALKPGIALAGRGAWTPEVVASITGYICKCRGTMQD